MRIEKVACSPSVTGAPFVRPGPATTAPRRRRDVNARAAGSPRAGRREAGRLELCGDVVGRLPWPALPVSRPARSSLASNATCAHQRCWASTAAIDGTPAPRRQWMTSRGRWNDTSHAPTSSDAGDPRPGGSRGTSRVRPHPQREGRRARPRAGTGPRFSCTPEAPTAHNRHAMETRPAPPRGDAAVHRHGRADAGTRHRRQHGHLQRDFGRPAEAAAVCASDESSRSITPRPASTSRAPAPRRSCTSPIAKTGRPSRTSRSGHGTVSVTGLAQPEEVPTLFATDGLLPILGVQPMLGRRVLEGGRRPGSARDRHPDRRVLAAKFGADRSTVGRTVTLDGSPREIIGVCRTRSASSNATCRWWCRAVRSQQGDARRVQLLRPSRG